MAYMLKKVSHPQPYIPEGREVYEVPESDQYMSAAKAVWFTSTELSHPTGAVVVKEGKMIGAAPNRGGIQNYKLALIHKTRFCIRRIFKIRSGTKYWMCPGCAKHKHHAEASSVRNAQRRVGDITGSDLYLYGHYWCCKPCWDAMIAAGIRNVFVVENAFNLFGRK